ncbi:unnamed protein product [Lampetra planeri]
MARFLSSSCCKENPTVHRRPRNLNDVVTISELNSGSSVGSSHSRREKGRPQEIAAESAPLAGRGHVTPSLVRAATRPCRDDARSRELGTRAARGNAAATAVVPRRHGNYR